MVFSALSVFSVVAFGLCTAEKLHLPVPTCKRDSNNYNFCLKDAITEAWPLFMKGLLEFDFPPLDPYFYPYQEGVFDTENVYAEVRAINNTIEGLRNMRIKAVRPHFIDDMFRLEIDIRVSKIFINGIIDGNGTFSGIRVGAKTNYNVTVEGIRSTWDISGPVKNDTWIIEHFHVTLFFRNLKIFADDLSQGNEEINKLALTFANEYWPQITRILLPHAIKYWDIYNSDLLTRFFAKLSFSEVFP